MRVINQAHFGSIVVYWLWSTWPESYISPWERGWIFQKYVVSQTFHICCDAKRSMMKESEKFLETNQCNSLALAITLYFNAYSSTVQAILMIQTTVTKIIHIHYGNRLMLIILPIIFGKLIWNCIIWLKLSFHHLLGDKYSSEQWFGRLSKSFASVWEHTVTNIWTYPNYQYFCCCQFSFSLPSLLSLALSKEMYYQLSAHCV